MGLNCTYIATKAGIFKLLTVVLGFVGLMLLSIACSEAEFFRADSMRVGTPGWLCSTEEDIKKQLGESYKPCPRTYMVFTPFSWQLISFLGSLIMLIALLIADLNKSSCFNLLDFLGHLFAGIVLIAGFLMTMVYVAFVMVRFPCTAQDDFTLRFSGVEACEKRRKEYYYMMEVGVGGFFCGITGILYCVTGCIVKKQKT